VEQVIRLVLLPKIKNVKITLNTNERQRATLSKQEEENKEIEHLSAINHEDTVIYA
jgi:hypothetical protein